jgi:hypothetical protein
MSKKDQRRDAEDAKPGGEARLIVDVPERMDRSGIRRR